MKDPRTPDTGTGVAQGPAHYAWKGDDARATSKRERAVRRYKLGPCQRCGVPGTDRHHVDGDTGNNAPENVRILCRRCHMIEDGRLDAVIERCRAPRPRKPRPSCRVCSAEIPVGKNFRGRCHRCNEYLRRNGVERPFGDANGRALLSAQQRAKSTAEPCLACNKSDVRKRARGLCAACYGRNLVADTLYDFPIRRHTKKKST